MINKEICKGNKCCCMVGDCKDKDCRKIICCHYICDHFKGCPYYEGDN